MPTWLSALAALANLFPAVIALIEQVIAAVQNHPAGPAVGIAEVSAAISQVPSK